MCLIMFDTVDSLFALGVLCFRYLFVMFVSFHLVFTIFIVITLAYKLRGYRGWFLVSFELLGFVVGCWWLVD